MKSACGSGPCPRGVLGDPAGGCAREPLHPCAAGCWSAPVGHLFRSRHLPVADASLTENLNKTGGAVLDLLSPTPCRLTACRRLRGVVGRRSPERSWLVRPCHRDILPRSRQRPLASTEGRAREKINKTGVRFWTENRRRSTR